MRAIAVGGTMVDIGTEALGTSIAKAATDPRNSSGATVVDEDALDSIPRGRGDGLG